MGILYESLVKMDEVGPAAKPQTPTPTPTVDQVSDAQKRFVQAELALKNASPRDKAKAAEEYRAAWWDYSEKRKAAEAADVPPAGTDNKAPEAPVPAPAPATAQPLVTADQIKALQRALIAKGQTLPPSKLAKDGVDGSFGPGTLKAVMAVLGTPAAKAPAAQAPAAQAPAPISTESVDTELPMLTTEPSLARIIQLAR